MVSILCSLLFKMIFMLALGCFLRRRGVLSRHDQQSLMTLLLKVIIPFLIIMSSQRDLDAESVKAVLVTAVSCIAMYAVGAPLVCILAQRLPLSEDERRVFVCSALFGNVAFIGYPVIQELYGDLGLLLATMATIVFNLAFFTCADPYLRRKAVRLNPRALLSNINVIVCTLSLVMYFAQVKIPEPVYSTFSYISDMSFPISMLVLGCMLADVDILGVLKNKQLYLISLLRLFVVPGLLYAALSLIGVDHTVAGILTVLASIPVGALVSVVAADSDTAPQYAVLAMMQTVILMFVSLPAWAFFLAM